MMISERSIPGWRRATIKKNFCGYLTWNVFGLLPPPPPGGFFNEKDFPKPKICEDVPKGEELGPNRAMFLGFIYIYIYNPREKGEGEGSSEEMAKEGWTKSSKKILKIVICRLDLMYYYIHIHRE